MCHQQLLVISFQALQSFDNILKVCSPSSQALCIVEPFPFFLSVVAVVDGSAVVTVARITSPRPFIRTDILLQAMQEQDSVLA